MGGVALGWLGPIAAFPAGGIAQQRVIDIIIDTDLSIDVDEWAIERNEQAPS